MTLSLHHRDLINITDLSRAEIEALLTAAQGFKAKPYQPILNHLVIASCFFEASTRTRLSFESAIQRLGARVIGFADPGSTSQRKGETLEDTTHMLMSYADAIIVRHPTAGSAQIMADISDKPVINAGDGGNQHPTQTLLDLFSIQETQGRLDGLTIALVGDLKYGRTVHSLVQAGALFGMKFIGVGPKELALPAYLQEWLHQRGVAYTTADSLREVIPQVDIVYMTRLQKERFSGEAIDASAFVLNKALLNSTRPNLKVLHPLPRVDEIHVDVDSHPAAYYFQQAANGVPVRQALLQAILG